MKLPVSFNLPEFDKVAMASNPRRVFDYAMLVLANISSVLAYVTTQYPEVAMVNGIACIFWAALLLWFHLGLSDEASCHLGSAIAAVMVCTTAWYSGGVYSSMLAWLSVLVIVNYFVIGPIAGLVWIVITLCVHIFETYSASWLGWGPLRVGTVFAQSANSLTDYSMIFICIALILFFYHRINERAYSDLVQRQTELQSKRKELEAALAVRDRFIASVSHELRTPMNAILGLSDHLKSSVKDKPGAIAVLEHTNQAADHLMTVINDVLDYTQFKSGQLRPQWEKVQLHDTLHNAFGLFQPRVSSSNLRYICQIDDSVPKWVHTDKHRLRQVLVNLLGNAIKFTESGFVLLSASADSEETVEFSVQDSGIGISEDEKARLFDRFSQANPTIQRRFGGSGLGLLISKQLVHLLGGTIGFDSEPAKGSRFWFRLPLKAVEAPEAPPTAESQHISPSSLHWRVLIVDDHPVNRLLLRQVLLSQWPGISVYDASGGQEALKVIQTQAIDLVLMDMVMPEMDGIETTRAIRSQSMGAAKALPILGLTANIHPPDLANFEEAGLNAIMLKPFNRVRLLQQVRELLS